MARFILLLAAFAVMVPVAVATHGDSTNDQSAYLKEYSDKDCKNLVKIVESFDGETCFGPYGSGGSKILGKVDKCEKGAQYDQTFFSTPNCTGPGNSTVPNSRRPINYEFNACGRLGFRWYIYECGSANSAMPVRISAATLFITAAVVVVSLL